MKSMTGYGSGVATFPGGRIQVDLRTVNHRFIEIKMPLPREFLPWEREFREMIEMQIKRGRVEMILTYLGRSERAYSVQPNLELARAYYSALQHLYRELGMKQTIDPAFLTSRQDFFQIIEQPQAVTNEIQAAKKALLGALTNLARQRSREGKFLQGELRRRITSLAKKRRVIQDRSRRFVHGPG